MPDERAYGGDADMEQDVTSIRYVALAFLAVVLVCIGLAIFLTHKNTPNWPQASVLEQDWRPYLKGTLDLPPPPAPVADAAPSPAVASPVDLPDNSDLRPSTDAPVVDAPVADTPAIPAPVADETPAPMFQQSGPETTPAVETAPAADAALPRATAADEAQHAHDHPLRRHRHYHRPHHHHQPQPQRHVSACPQYAIDYYDPFAALFHGIECLIEEMSE